MTTKIFFVRHGEVINPKNIWYGRFPGFPLSANGKKQILKTAQTLSARDIDAVYASPLLRTKQSAKIIADTLRLSVNYSDHLLEVHSSLQGQTFADIASRWAEDIYASSKKKIIGETIGQVSERMRKFISATIKFHAGKNIVAVSHGDPIMIVKAVSKGLPLEINSIRPAKGYIGHGEVHTAEFNSQEF